PAAPFTTHSDRGRAFPGGDLPGRGPIRYPGACGTLAATASRSSTMRVLASAITTLVGAALLVPAAGARQQPGANLDATVRAFLDARRGTWRDLNVPESDGQLLHDLIVKHKFTRALEIGTSTGHSGIWIAWALAKTGGRLTTLEIDPERHRIAL